MKTDKLKMKLLEEIQILFLLMVAIGCRKVRSDLRVVSAGSTTTLNCANEPGNEFIMSTWKVHRVYKPPCHMAFTMQENKTFNDCNNRTHQYIGTKRVTLTIKNITLSDEGNYTCEIANERGTPTSTIALQVLVTPIVLIRLTSSRSAECHAIGGHPAATIWWNSSFLYEVTNTTSMEENKTTTVTSTYTSKEDNETEATCIIHHPAFKSPVVLNITIPAAGTKKMWWVSLPVVVVLVVLVIILLLWKRSSLRNFFANKKEDTSGLQENPAVIVEEVEPYASFTQKVNTIYNSTSELSEAKEKNLTTGDGMKRIYF
ncbi:cell surface glycoprotein CD200 receptor 2-like [Rana temporaria]|uniref:cell surface glycoprotein CD200 receptor 2-like n=1 Tax=Rana temporaria TaxID=8407 RepID=UPI001AAE0FF8|nr:cell surface glycoprotein CD200 receptor 2-like [Rana temporaria]